jgi:hypothetical protein
MGTVSPEGAFHVIWREGTWRCESGLVQGQPVLRLYDWDTLGLEHEVMRQSVLRYLSGELAAGNPSRRWDTKAIGPGWGIFTVCRQCGSLRAYLRARRPGKDWYFCPGCTHQWDVPSGS